MERFGWNVDAEPAGGGDGDFDGDEDGLIDRQEFALASQQPDNGIDHPSDAPLLHVDGDFQQPTEKAQRVFNILISKETRESVCSTISMPGSKVNRPTPSSKSYSA